MKTTVIFYFFQTPDQPIKVYNLLITYLIIRIYKYFTKWISEFTSDLFNVYYMLFYSQLYRYFSDNVRRNLQNYFIILQKQCNKVLNLCDKLVRDFLC